VSPNELWIAASAWQHGLVVLTLDGDFSKIPQVIVRRFDPPPVT
jgi:predicted nucleic acid-binding protein